MWTGSAYVVWIAPEEGAVYDYAADAWRQMTTTGAPRRRRGATALCAGDQVVVWGGDLPAPDVDRQRYGSVMYRDGAIYDLPSDTWRALPLEGAPRPGFGQRSFSETQQIEVVTCTLFEWDGQRV